MIRSDEAEAPGGNLVNLGSTCDCVSWRVKCARVLHGVFECSGAHALLREVLGGVLTQQKGWR